MKPPLTRRCLAEFAGAFGIVFAPVALAGAAAFPGAETSLMAAAWTSGLAVLAMIYALGHLSGAHFNPAVTLAFTAAGRFPAREVLPYVAAQLGGGIAAAAAGALLYGPGHGAQAPTAAWPVALGTEVCLTFLLMLVISAVATDRRAHGAVPGLAIGSTVVFAVLIGGPVTGGSMNPARALGPALFAGGPALGGYWIYVLGPVLGAVAAARLYELLRGGEEHARGAPDELCSGRGREACAGRGA